jgi:hypothetical protein
MILSYMVLYCLGTDAQYAKAGSVLLVLGHTKVAIGVGNEQIDSHNPAQYVDYHIHLSLMIHHLSSSLQCLRGMI